MACISILSLAHSGRTDSNGGHRDNKNKSGLGYYHYHCGGYPPHLHTDGVCPYKRAETQNTEEKNLNKSDNELKNDNRTATKSKDSQSYVVASTIMSFIKMFFIRVMGL